MIKQALSLKIKRENNYLKVLIFGFILTFIAGCGGGSSSTTVSNDNITYDTAQFVDSPVAGLDYKTDSLSGVTDSNGEFKYNKNDKKVEFFVGTIKIGEFNLSKLNTDKKILPSELFGLDRNNTTDDRVIKVIRFLQSLDNDSNISNGITIDDLTKDILRALTETNDTVNKNLTDNKITVIEDMLKGVGKTLMPERNARENYKKYLQNELNITPDFMPFTMVWSVSEDDTNITIPINPDYAEEYNYTVDWGDGNISTDVNDSITHTYAKEGNYTVKITGSFPAIYLNNDGESIDYQNMLSNNCDLNHIDKCPLLKKIGNADKLIKIVKWGDVEWKSFENAFSGAQNLSVVATDSPNLTNVSSLKGMFSGCINFNSTDIINEFNVSNIEDTSWMFFGDKEFNNNLKDWDVSNVKYMDMMFCCANSFNQSLNKWNVSNVIDASYFSYESNITELPSFNFNNIDRTNTNIEDNGSLEILKIEEVISDDYKDKIKLIEWYDDNDKIAEGHGLVYIYLEDNKSRIYTMKFFDLEDNLIYQKEIFVIYQSDSDNYVILNDFQSR